MMGCQDREERHWNGAEPALHTGIAMGSGDISHIPAIMEHIVCWGKQAQNAGRKGSHGKPLLSCQGLGMCWIKRRAQAVRPCLFSHCPAVGNRCEGYVHSPCRRLLSPTLPKQV